MNRNFYSKFFIEIKERIKEFIKVFREIKYNFHVGAQKELREGSDRIWESMLI